MEEKNIPHWFLEGAAIRNSPLHKNPSIAETPCKIVSGWKDLEKQINKLDPKTHPQIFIADNTHGSSGGFDYPDAGKSSPQEILSALERFASKFKVGALLGSCFSGDLLVSKLIQDEGIEHPETSASLSNLCVLASSLPGREASSKTLYPLQDSLIQARAGESLQELAEHALPSSGDGLISSSPWSSAGISHFLVTRRIGDGLRAMEGINSALYAPRCPCEDVVQRAKLLSRSSLSSDPDRLIAALLFVKNVSKMSVNANIHVPEKKINILTSVSLVTLTNKIYTTRVNDPELSCLRELEKIAAPIAISESILAFFDEVPKILAPLDAKSDDDPCKKFAATRGKLPSALAENFFPEVFEAKREYGDALRTIRETFGKEATEELSSDELMIHKPNAEGEAERRPLARFLAATLSQDYEKDPFRGDDVTVAGSLATGDLLHGFTAATFSAPEPTDPRDKARKSACVNFKF